MSGKCTRRCCYCSLFSSCKRQGKLMKREGLQRQTATHIYHRKHPRYQGALKTNAPTFEDEEEDQAYDDVWPPLPRVRRRVSRPANTTTRTNPGERFFPSSPTA